MVLDFNVLWVKARTQHLNKIINNNKILKFIYFTESNDFLSWKFTKCNPHNKKVLRYKRVQNTSWSYTALQVHFNQSLTFSFSLDFSFSDCLPLSLSFSLLAESSLLLPSPLSPLLALSFRFVEFSCLLCVMKKEDQVSQMQ